MVKEKRLCKKSGSLINFKDKFWSGDNIIKEVIRVPKDRIRVIKDKKAKEEVEKNLDVKLSFQENAIEIDGEGLNLYQAKNIVKAIGRGFSPERAFRLFNEEEELHIIELKGFNDKKIKVIKSRVIGKNGRTRKTIEEYCGCLLSVYGKTISIIGKYNEVRKAEEAIDMLIRGVKHGSVYGFLKRK